MFETSFGKFQQNSLFSFISKNNNDQKTFKNTLKVKFNKNKFDYFLTERKLKIKMKKFQDKKFKKNNIMYVNNKEYNLNHQKKLLSGISPYSTASNFYKIGSKMKQNINNNFISRKDSYSEDKLNLCIQNINNPQTEKNNINKYNLEQYLCENIGPYINLNNIKSSKNPKNDNKHLPYLNFLNDNHINKFLLIDKEFNNFINPNYTNNNFYSSKKIYENNKKKVLNNYNNTYNIFNLLNSSNNSKNNNTNLNNGKSGNNNLTLNSTHSNISNVGNNNIIFNGGNISKNSNKFIFNKNIKITEKPIYNILKQKSKEKFIIHNSKFLKEEILNDKEKQSNNIRPISTEPTENKKEEKTDLNLFSKKYDIGRQLGKGAYAEVRLVINKVSREKFAMKIYEKSKINNELKKKCVKKEIEIMKKINHKNFAKFIEVVDTEKQILIIQEFINGISLREYYNKQIRYQKGISLHKEKIFKNIFKQIFNAMNYLHKKNMAHRDIKLENILMTKNYEIKIIDFGFGMYNPENKLQTFFCGTPNYMPPEIIDKKLYVGQYADLWSLGILVYKFYCADFPFKGKNEKELYQAVKNGKFEMADYTPTCVKEIISKLIVKEPDKRMSCQEVLDSEWLKD